MHIQVKLKGKNSKYAEHFIKQWENIKVEQKGPQVIAGRPMQIRQRSNSEDGRLLKQNAWILHYAENNALYISLGTRQLHITQDSQHLYF